MQVVNRQRAKAAERKQAESERKESRRVEEAGIKHSSPDVLTDGKATAEGRRGQEGRVETGG